MTESALISVRVTPRSGKDELQGWREGVLRVRLRAPPLEGRANQALVRLLADRLGLAPSRIDVVSGETARTKRLRIEGLTEDEVRARLAGPA